MRKTALFAGMLLLSGWMMFSCGNAPEKEGKYSDRETIETILSRKSVRDYTNRPVEQEKVDLLLRAGMAAPSGRDLRPWELVVVNDRGVLDSLASALPYAKMLAKAPMAMIVCGDTTRSSYWYLDCSAAAENILLTAEALGLGAVWTAAYPYRDRMAAVAGCTGLPAQVLPLTVIPIGYPQGVHTPKDKFDTTRIHYNKW